MPSEFEARKSIVDVGRRIWQRGYVAANDGNLSVRLSDDRVLVTPTGRSKGFLAPDDLVMVDLEGRKVSGRLEASSELAMHLFAYRARPDVRGIVHAHPPKATGFAVAGVPLAQCILPEVILTVGKVPLTEYATPATPEVPASIDQFIGGYNAILLRNHGVLTLGRGIDEAYFRLETVEHFAEITLAAKALGGAAPLAREDVQKLLKVRERLDVGAPPGSCFECGACEGSSGGAGGEVEGRGAASPADGDGRPDDEEIVRAVLREVEKALGERR